MIEYKSFLNYVLTFPSGYRGFRGYHRCGVTLLSAPPKKTIFVSAAHCNYICKSETGLPVQTCCCRDSSEPSTCRGVSRTNSGHEDPIILHFFKFNSYCGRNATLQAAEPQDLQIVCQEWDIIQVC